MMVVCFATNVFGAEVIDITEDLKDQFLTGHNRYRTEQHANDMQELVRLFFLTIYVYVYVWWHLSAIFQSFRLFVYIICLVGPLKTDRL